MALPDALYLGCVAFLEFDFGGVAEGEREGETRN